MTLTDEIDIARGDVLSSPDSRPEVADQFTAQSFMDERRADAARAVLSAQDRRTHDAGCGDRSQAPSRRQQFRQACRQGARSQRSRLLQYRHDHGRGLRPLCRQSRHRRLHSDRSRHERDRGRGHDRAWAQARDQCASAWALQSIARRMRRSSTRSRRSSGSLASPGAGKSTIANLVEARLHARGVHTTLLDGDNVRHGLNKDLGFTAADRVENIRRVGEVARLMTDAGLIVLCSFISPFRAERRLVRDTAATGRVHRDLRRYAARDGDRPRSQRFVQAGLGWRDQEFHRRRPAL